MKYCTKRKRTEKTSTLKIADLELDQITHKVKRAGKEIDLTNKEYALLEYLLLHANQVVTRTMISEHVWDENFDCGIRMYEPTRNDCTFRRTATSSISIFQIDSPDINVSFLGFLLLFLVDLLKNIHKNHSTI